MMKFRIGFNRLIEYIVIRYRKWQLQRKFEKRFKVIRGLTQQLEKDIAKYHKEKRK